MVLREATSVTSRAALVVVIAALVVVVGFFSAKPKEESNFLVLCELEANFLALISKASMKLLEVGNLCFLAAFLALFSYGPSNLLPLLE